MYFITKRSSATGKKFKAAEAKLEIARQAQIAMSEELGFTQWRGGYWVAWGRLSSVMFEKEPDMKVWKRVAKNEYMPRLNSKVGKALAARFKALPVLESRELNACIGFKEIFKTIGFNMCHKTYFGFIVEEKWNIKIPTDCTEVTTSNYRKLFGKAEKNDD